LHTGIKPLARDQRWSPRAAHTPGRPPICSFWLVSALAEVGEHQRARDTCEKVLSCASPLQLCGEEIDPRSGRHLGDFPQALTHLALINAVMHVISNEQTARRLALGRDIADRHV
jgi:alpha,alpha-trehalase